MHIQNNFIAFHVQKFHKENYNKKGKKQQQQQEGGNTLFICGNSILHVQCICTDSVYVFSQF